MAENLSIPAMFRTDYTDAPSVGHLRNGPTYDRTSCPAWPEASELSCPE
jgi:hypothetical protein